MANGFDASMKRTTAATHPDAKLGSRRIFPPQFKLQVLHSYRNDSDCRGNQRATARKYGIHRRQIQKWLQAEPALRGALDRRGAAPSPSPVPALAPAPAPAPAPVEPVDLTVKRTERPPSPPLAWDLSYKPKFGYEPEAPKPRPQRKLRLFRPYLPEDNFGEPESEPESPPGTPTPPPVYAELVPAPRASSAFERLPSGEALRFHPRVVPYCVDFRVQAARSPRRIPRPLAWEYPEAVASAS